MLNTKLSPWPSFSSEEADAVKNVLLSSKVNYWTGQECRLCNDLALSAQVTSLIDRPQ